jgi:RNA polymerase sigma factor (sigma-70 family)
VVGRPLEEAELIERAKRGDPAAYRTLLEMHEQIAFRTAYAVTRNAADAEDVTQEAFLKAYLSLERFRRGAPFRPWLLRIVGNEARNRVRARSRRQRLAEAAAADPLASRGAVPPPEAHVLAAEEHRELVAAVDRLRPDERLAVVARYFLGLTDEETAAALGVRRGAVKMRVFRALERLRHELGGGE